MAKNGLNRFVCHSELIKICSEPAPERVPTVPLKVGFLEFGFDLPFENRTEVDWTGSASFASGNKDESRRRSTPCLPVFLKSLGQGTNQRDYGFAPLGLRLAHKAIPHRLGNPESALSQVFPEQPTDLTFAQPGERGRVNNRG